jgi:hypothetical protein
MIEKSNWIAPARLRQLEDGTAPPETRFYASAWFPPGGWTATIRAEFEAGEQARREECAEYERRWLAGEEIEDIRHDLRRRKDAAVAAVAATEPELTREELAEATERRKRLYGGSEPSY